MNVAAAAVLAGALLAPPPTLWSEKQAASIATVRGTPVHVRYCHGLGTAVRSGGRKLYRRFRCLAGARAPWERFDTVAVDYVLRPLAAYTGRSSKVALTNVRFTALNVP